MSDPHSPVSAPITRPAPPARAAWEQPAVRRLDAAEAEIAPSPIVDGITIS